MVSIAIMNPLTALDQAIDLWIQEGQARIVAEAERIRNFRHALCTYRENLPQYRALKIALGRHDRLSDPFEICTWVFKRMDRMDLERQVRELRQEMYRNPCMECEACQTRRQPWTPAISNL